MVLFMSYMRFKIINELKRINYVVGDQFKAQLILLTILLIFSAFLEMVGIGLIPVIVTIVIDFENVIRLLSDFLSNFQFTNNIELQSYGVENFLICIFLFFLGKNIFILWIFYFETKLEYKIKKNITNRIFEKYIKSSYENFHLKRKSSELIRNLAIEVSNFSSYLNAFINLVRETSVFIFLISLLLFANFKLTVLVLGFFLLIVTIYYFSFSKKIKMSGREYVELKEKIINKISQIIYSIKEVFLYEKEEIIQKNFVKDVNIYEFKIFFLNFTKKIPRVILEVSAIGLITFFLIFFFDKYNTVEIISIASLIGLCAIRMVPSLNTITNSIINIKFYRTSFSIIHDELYEYYPGDNKFDNNLKVASFDRIELKNVTYYYYNSKVPIFKNLNLVISNGELIKITGSSGKGKSTFLNIISGLLKIKSGSLEFFEKDKILEKHKVKKLFAYVPQDIFIFDGTIKENILFGANEDVAKLSRCVEESNLSEFINNTSSGLETYCGQNGINLSGGQKQRLAIARALYANKQILLFDEITSNLDNENSEKIVETINRLKSSKTILYITHKDTRNLKYDKLLDLDAY